MKNDDKSVFPSTAFVLAVQETNFLYSFVFSAFVATGTVFDILTDGNFTEYTAMVLLTGGLYMTIGLGITIFLYGRKQRGLDDFDEVHRASQGNYRVQDEEDNDDLIDN